jgi:hypothetical protein
MAQYVPHPLHVIEQDALFLASSLFYGFRS